MIPIQQTVFSVPGGNCLSACVASLLEISLLDVPYFGGDDEWWASLRRWLQPRGLYALNSTLDASPDAWRPEGYYILAGQSPRGPWLHAVVARGHEIVHDPHPSRAGILAHKDATILVPFSPADVPRARATVGEIFPD